MSEPDAAATTPATPPPGPTALGTGKAARPPRQPAPAPEPTERKFKVLRDQRIPQGASNFTLPAGKIISDRHYDIQALRGHGAALEEVK